MNTSIRIITNKKFFLFLSTLFFLSRIVFINYGPVFFDSPEYLSRLQQTNLLDGLLAGHWPYHFGYIFLYYPLFVLLRTVSNNPLYFVMLIQVVLSFLAVFWFYRCIEMLTDSKTALKSAIIVSLLPLFWISNGTVMVETTYLAFFIGSLYFFTRYVKENLTERYFFVSVLFFGYSFSINSVVVLWFPLFLFLAFQNKRNHLLKIVFCYLCALFVALFVEGFFVSHLGEKNILKTISNSYLSKRHEFTYFSFSVNGILINLRNVIIPLLRNNTNVVVLLSFVSLTKLIWIKDKGKFVFGLLWLLPAILVNQWSDSLFYGRQALLASFGLAFLTGYYISKKRALFVLYGYLLLVSLPALFLLKEPIPYIEEANLVRNLPAKSLLLESHFARPQVAGIYSGKALFVNEPNSDSHPKETIEKALSQNTPVFISAQALSEPYGLYCGPYLHILGLSYYNGFSLQGIITSFKLEQYRIGSLKDNIVLYRVVSEQPSLYPPVPRLDHWRRRIDFFDPFSQAWLLWLNRANL